MIYTTDNGAEVMSWPDGGTTPFRGEKNTNWEGGYRVPAMVRWPGLVKPGTEINDVFSAEDWMQTLMGAVGESDLKAKLQQGATFGAKSFKVLLDGYDQRNLLANGSGGARKEFFYWTDDGGLAGLRYDKWKLAFMEQRSHGFDVWQDPMVTLRVPKLFDLRADPSSAAIMRASATTAGASTAFSCWCRPRFSSSATSKAWSSSRRVNGRGRSTWRACSTS